MTNSEADYGKAPWHECVYTCGYNYLHLEGSGGGAFSSSLTCPLCLLDELPFGVRMGIAPRFMSVGPISHHRGGSSSHF